MMSRRLATKIAAITVVVALSLGSTAAFQTPPLSTSTRVSYTTNLFSTPPERSQEQPTKPPLSTLVKRVAVAGATGRTGKLVVQQLLAQNVPVLALVRDTDRQRIH